MMVRERITRQGEWLGLNRAAAYTLYQPRAQITLRLKTEHVNAQESWWHRNEEWATIFLAPSPFHSRTLTLFISSFCQIFFLTPPPLLPSPPHPCSLFLPNNSLWAFLLFHWFCYVYLLLHLWNWRHRPTRLLLFNNRSWAFSLALGYQWCQTENVTSHHFEKADSLLYCCCVLYRRRNFSHLCREDCESQQQVWSSTKRTMWFARQWICFLIDPNAVLYVSH